MGQPPGFSQGDIGKKICTRREIVHYLAAELLHLPAKPAGVGKGVPRHV
jgi:hypothetical protein